MEREEELKGLQAEVTRWRRRNPGARIQHDLKARLISTAQKEVECGVSPKHTAKRLGLEPSTLYRWLRVETTVTKVEGMLREMKVIGPEAPARGPSIRPRIDVEDDELRRPRLRLPGGIVVEDLDTEQVITIVRALR